jgi:hypothetical protein
MKRLTEKEKKKKKKDNVFDNSLKKLCRTTLPVFVCRQLRDNCKGLHNVSAM